MIYFLIVGLIFVLWISFTSNKGDIMTPSFLFTAPFVVACICAAVYSNKWSLDLHLNTLLVILLGCLEFTLVCILVHATYGRRIVSRIKVNPQKYQAFTGVDFKIKTWKIVSLCVVQVISAVVVVRSMRSTLSQYGVGGGSLSSIMYYFREYQIFQDYDVSLSSLASNLRLFSIASSYIVIYVLVNNIICKVPGRNLLPLIASIALGVINSVLLGARGEAIQLIVAAIVIYFLLMRKYNGWKPKVKFKTIILVGILLFVIIITFKSTGNLLGRGEASYAKTMTVSAFDEVAKYLGAEIKNLDIFLQDNWSDRKSTYGNQTFGNILLWISNQLNLGWKIEKDLPFQRVNGISLGNVYTVFYTFIYDFGYMGEIFLVPVMALFSQILYDRIPLDGNRSKVSFRIILSSYVLFLIAFSFFGERVFSYVLNISFVKYILIWYMMIWYFTRLKVKLH